MVSLAAKLSQAPTSACIRAVCNRSVSKAHESMSADSSRIERRATKRLSIDPVMRPIRTDPVPPAARDWPSRLRDC